MDRDRASSSSGPKSGGVGWLELRVCARGFGAARETDMDDVKGYLLMKPDNGGWAGEPPLLLLAY